VVARAAARLAGVPWQTLPPAQAGRIMALALVGRQLRELPDWLNKWAGEDDTLLFSLLGRCQAHEGRFFRSDVGPGSADAGQPRVVIDPALSADDSA